MCATVTYYKHHAFLIISVSMEGGHSLQVEMFTRFE